MSSSSYQLTSLPRVGSTIAGGPNLSEAIDTRGSRRALMRVFGGEVR